MIYIHCPRCAKANLIHNIEDIHSGMVFVCGKCYEPLIIEIHARYRAKDIEVSPRNVEEENK